MKRLLTALVALPLVLLAVLRLPTEWFFLFVVVLLEVAIFEYARLGRRVAAGVPLWALMVAVPPVALALCLHTLGVSYFIGHGQLYVLGLGEISWDGLEGVWLGLTPEGLLLFIMAIVPLGFGTLALFSRAPLEQALSGLGLLAFGLPYFALPIAALTLLQGTDRWLLLMMLAIVWVGDTFAYYLGTKWGRHKMAPVISPHKSWEGAAAGMMGSLLAACLFLWWQPADFEWRLLALAAVTAAAAQVGDLMESLVKRAVAVKDSGSLLPGHGGAFDRVDALLFAAPVWYVGLRLLGRLEHLP